MIKKIFNLVTKKRVTKKRPSSLDKKKTEEKAVAGVRRAVKEYKEVFERLAEYDKI